MQTRTESKIALIKCQDDEKGRVVNMIWQLPLGKFFRDEMAVWLLHKRTNMKENCLILTL